MAVKKTSKKLLSVFFHHFVINFFKDAKCGLKLASFHTTFCSEAEFQILGIKFS